MRALPRALLAAALLSLLVVWPVLARPQERVFAEDIAGEGDLPRRPPCETVECATPVFDPPRRGVNPPPSFFKVVVWTSGVDLNFLNGNDGGIFIARATGQDVRRLTRFQNGNRELDDHGLNLPDDHPSLSPGSDEVVFTSNRADKDNFDLWTMDVNGAGKQRLTTHPALDTEAVYSPDGERLAWATGRFGNLNIAVMDSDGTGPITRVTSDSTEEIEPAWSPDGERISFSRVLGPGEKDVFITNSDGSGVETRVTNVPGEDHDATFSPDGTQIVVTSERAPTSPPFGNVYRLDAATGVPVTEGDAVGEADGDLTDDFDLAAGDPFWSRDGQTIAFFKSVLPTLGPMALFVMNADGTGKTYIPGEGAVNVHPAIGSAVDTDADGTPDFLESAGVGTASVQPRRVHTGRFERIRFAWRHPQRWRKLDTIYLKLYGHKRLLTGLRFVVRDRSLSLLDPGRGYWTRARRLERGRLRVRGVRIALQRTHFLHPSRKRLVVEVAARFGRRTCARKPYRVFVQASDAKERNQEEPLGRLRIRCPERKDR